MSAERDWAKRHLLAELAELKVVGYACNVQSWDNDNVKTNVPECKARRREALRLLNIAMDAVKAAS